MGEVPLSHFVNAPPLGERSQDLRNQLRQTIQLRHDCVRTLIRQAEDAAVNAHALVLGQSILDRTKDVD